MIDKLSSLRPQTIDEIRNLAVRLENSDLETALELMKIALHGRPNGPFIKKKVREYESKLNSNPPDVLLQELLDTKKLALIPFGFRCHTRIRIRELFNITSESYPFDNGFFPPESIASILLNPKLNLSMNNDSHCVCEKFENYQHEKLGKGIMFKTSSYENINEIVTSRNMENINQYLDSTFGYYTLDKQHRFILAHYNWHKLADKNKSKGITSPKKNIENINNLLNRRINRLFNICEVAEDVVFVYSELQGYKYMMIDNEVMTLSNLDVLEKTMKTVFSNSNCHVVNISEINSSAKLLKLLNKKI